MIRAFTLAVLAAGLITPGALAQNSADKSADKPVAKSAVSDSLFAMAAAEGGLAEVTLAELGVSRATNPELKKLSQQMVDEHSKMNSDLNALATSKGLTLPQALDASHQFCAQSLAGLSGEEFDRAYAEAQYLLHMTAVAMFETEAQHGQDDEIKALASKSLPHIKKHLSQIKPIAMKHEREHEKAGHASKGSKE